MKSTNAPKNPVLSAAKKKIAAGRLLALSVALKAPIKATKVAMPRLAGNHNETLVAW